MPRRSRLALAAAFAAWLAATGPHGATPPGAAVFAGAYTWTAAVEDFGGLSGLELWDGGARILALGDRGLVIEGRIERDAGGAVTGITIDRDDRLRDASGQPVTRRNADSEGIVRLPDGSFYVSFEALHRIERYAELGASAETLPVPRDFAGLQLNSGLEALAADAEGRLYAIPERSGQLGRPFPVYRFDGTDWDIPFTLPRDGDLLPVGADFGPDGKLYLLERDFRGFLGFRTRISRFAIGPDGAGPRELLVETRGPVHDNLEGIAVWQDASGATRLTMISDDNFSRFQRTEIVDYRVAD